MQRRKKVKRLSRQLLTADGTRISREGLPNGFFFKNLLWFGDSFSNETGVYGRETIPGGENTEDNRQ
jgi:hypothetical protein